MKQRSNTNETVSPTSSIHTTYGSWNRYYIETHRKQKYPDENLVRLLSPICRGSVLDFGCGQGRHLLLCKELGFSPVYAADISKEALSQSCQNFPFAKAIQLPEEFWSSKAFQLNLKANSLQVIIAWGVLHYNSKNVAENIVQELKRLLRPSGFLLGTLRSSHDTHLKTRSEVPNENWDLYDEKQSRLFLGKHFETVQLGYMERTPLEHLDQRICHWFFSVQKEKNQAC